VPDESGPLQLARRWFAALDQRDADGAAELVSEDCRITNPTGAEDFVGPAGARELLRMAPPTLRRSLRGERLEGNAVIVEGLTRVPGLFANFTTWTIETDGQRITRIAFAWRPAN
jgi:limonene-1,2-epoxide hydrolase